MKTTRKYGEFGLLLKKIFGPEEKRERCISSVKNFIHRTILKGCISSVKKY